MKTKKPFIKLFSNLLLATLLAASGSAYAAGAGAAQIAVFASGLSISSPGTANVTSLTLRIAGPDDSVTNLKSNGTAIDWSAAGMVDGNYRYEVYVTTSIDGSENTETTITRGLMKIFQGMIVDEQNNAAVEYDTYDLLAGLKAESLGIANNLLDMLVPGAQAQSLTASGLVGGDVVFDSTDTSDNRDWVISGKAMAGPPFSGNFTIIDDVDDAAYNNKTVFDIAHSLNNENSIIVDDNGDIGLANGGFFFDRSSKRMGINTITPAQGIHVLATSSKSSMALRMENTSESTWDIGQNSGGDYFVSIVTNGNSG
ncbi:MAG TPA: hypothetical protein ENG90_07565, partial [Gammaproteobacteria bacterium]|nr:hypothetical protein [Gammaproteobacteria bacterium]